MTKRLDAAEGDAISSATIRTMSLCIVGRVK
jgi:hypothetical protein